jgi:hypothetical protein
LSQQNTKAGRGRTSGTEAVTCCVAALLQRAATKARRTASANTAWLLSAGSSRKMGRFGYRDREQSHSPSSQARRRTLQLGSSNPIRVIAASVQAPASIRRSSVIVFPICRSEGSRVQAPLSVTLRNRRAVTAGAKYNSRSSRSRSNDCDSGAGMTGSHKELLLLRSSQMAMKVIKKLDQTQLQNMYIS